MEVATTQRDNVNNTQKLNIKTAAAAAAAAAASLRNKEKACVQQVMINARSQLKNAHCLFNRSDYD